MKYIPHAFMVTIIGLLGVLICSNREWYEATMICSIVVFFGIVWLGFLWKRVEKKFDEVKEYSKKVGRALNWQEKHEEYHEKFDAATAELIKDSKKQSVKGYVRKGDKIITFRKEA